ncbi:ribosomal protein S18 acetylase RimI-like enzyme [Actinoplanes tereljensis]|uniref:N-acetyltransferase n=1 Tax=Paractinoplanes tereljensis TaxID=571912 RepID=A0A919TR82_9ACTN|nr:GNAT family N-acetyltransferase [Actinoplanes tereljensis]GIF18949.1 N-acetyltransferase [Actinoplanes tereljensis]
MSITTRRAELSDAALLHDLAALTFGLACPPGTLQSDIDAFIAKNLSADNFRAYLADPERIVLLAAADGVPVGYSMLVGGPIADPEVAATVAAASYGKSSIELSKFYLAPDRHGSGVAAALMAATLTEAAGTGAEFCWLGVNQRNERAAKFYTKQGFEVVGVKRFLVGDVWHDDHVRLRPLLP